MDHPDLEISESRCGDAVVLHLKGTATKVSAAAFILAAYAAFLRVV